MSAHTAYPEIDVAEASRSLDRYRCVDVREDFEFDGPLGHIEGAELVSSSELAARAAELAGGPPLLVICRSGNRSGKACALLAEHGLANATNLAGGMIAWGSAGLPIARARYASLDALLGGIARWLAQVGGREPAQARREVDGLLEAAGGTAKAPRTSDVEAVLRALPQRFEQLPADLGLALECFRDDLAAL